MNKKRNNYFIIIPSLFLVMILISVGYIMGSKGLNDGINNANAEFAKKDGIIKQEGEKYNKNATKIDYSLTFTGFSLQEFNSNGKIFMSGGVINIDGKTLTGEYLKLVNTEITSSGGKLFFKKSAIQVLGDLSFSGASKKDKDELLNHEKESLYELKFIKGFTKMKLRGKIYQFTESNLGYGNKYDFELYIVGKKAYVITFENAKEKEKRQKQIDDFEKKIKEIKDKYGEDPYIVNNLIDKLNKEHNIDINNQ